ncbi:Conjugative transfer protein TrbL [plant metagenome]
MKSPPHIPKAFIALIAVAGLLVQGVASGQTLDPFQQTDASMQAASLAVADKLAPYGFRLLGLLFIIQLALRHGKQMFAGTELTQILAKLVFSVIWIGFLMWLINSHFYVLNAIFSSFQTLGGIAAGGVDISPGKIMSVGIQLQNNLGASYNDATGANDGLVAALKHFFPSLMMMVACVSIMVSFFVIALAVAIATLEFYMIVAAAPIAFAMGGLDALKQSSISPLQAMLSIGYRVLILGVIVGVIGTQVGAWDAAFKTVKINDWTPIWTVVFGSLLGAVAAFSAGKIAAALASGQSNISGNEAMFAGLQMMQTVATTSTAVFAAAQIAAEAAKATGSAAGMLQNGATRLSDVLGSGSGSITNSSYDQAPGSPDKATPAQTAQSMLGALPGNPVAQSNGGATFSNEASDPSGANSGLQAVGNASDAGVSGGSGRSAYSPDTGVGDGSKTYAERSEARVAAALENWNKSMSKSPSSTSQLGRAAIGQVQGMQHDSGHVQVAVDTHDRS